MQKLREDCPHYSRPSKKLVHSADVCYSYCFLLVFEGESCDISLDVCVSPDVVATVQSGVSLLSCIIVLTLVGGKDFFISITGRFVPTSFGLPLTLLLRLPATPVALLPPDQIAQLVCFLLPQSLVPLDS